MSKKKKPAPKSRSRKTKFTQQQVASALRSTQGLMFLAAKNLGCDTDTLRNYRKRFPELEAVIADARGQVVDLAESKLWKALQDGEGWAITFFLRTQGKDRGYSERIDLSHSGSIKHDVKSLTDDELDAIIRADKPPHGGDGVQGKAASTP